MVESLDDLGENRVRLATGVDESSDTMPLPLDEQRVNCNKTDTETNQIQYHQKQTSDWLVSVKSQLKGNVPRNDQEAMKQDMKSMK